MSACDLVRLVTAALEEDDLSVVLDRMDFEASLCRYFDDPTQVAAAEGAGLWSCFDEMPDFATRCPAPRPPDDQCTLSRTLVDMSGSGMTHWNLRWLTRDELAKHILPGARVVGLINGSVITTGFAREGEFFIVLRTDPVALDGEYGYQVGDTWAARVDPASLRIVGLGYFRSDRYSHYGVVTPIPWP